MQAFVRALCLVELEEHGLEALGSIDDHRVAADLLAAGDSCHDLVFVLLVDAEAHAVDLGATLVADLAEAIAFLARHLVEAGRTFWSPPNPRSTVVFGSFFTWVAQARPCIWRTASQMSATPEEPWARP